MPLTTDLAIRKWKPRQDGEAVSTGGRHGLYVRGWMSGTKAFYFRAGTWMKIGEYPDTSLAIANELAVVARRLVKEGYGKAALARCFALCKTAAELEAVVKGAFLTNVVGRSLPTYSDMFTDWFSTIEPGLQEGPSRRRPKAIHDLHIAPKIGNRPINEMRRREVFEVLSGLYRDTPVTAGHALGHLRKVFERAVNLELIEANPVPPREAFPAITRQKKHHGTLQPSRMAELWQWLQGRSASQTAKLAILTSMCTAHRIGVIVNAGWQDIDPETGIWTVPTREDKATLGRMKSGRSYSLKLPERLLILLLENRQSPSQSYVFESPSTTGPISPNAILKTLKSFEPSMTTHGFPNTVKVWCRGADPAIPDHIADAFCDHALRGLDASYRRADTSLERAAVAERLFDFVHCD